MKYTANYNLKKPEGTDIVNIDDLNDNADILDQKLKEVENKADNAPPNSVNDAAIGSRTPDQSQAPASPGTGTLTQLISWQANRIKAITGKTNWWDAPPTTLQAAKNHHDATAPHSGHETPAGAQAKANAAEANAKGYTDTHAGTKNTHGVGSGYYIAKTSRSDQLPAWNEVQGKPSNFTPSAHKSTHASGGSDALTPSDIGAETPAGAQAKANTALNSAKAYTDQEVGEVSQALDAHKAENSSTTAKGHVQLNNTVTSTSTTQAATANAVKTVNDALTSHKAENASTTAKGHVQLSSSTSSTSTSLAATARAVKTVNDALTSHKAAAAPHSGHETPAGAQAKAEAAAGAVQAELDAHKADYVHHIEADMPHQFTNHKTHKTYAFGFQISVDGKPQIIYEEVSV